MIDLLIVISVCLLEPYFNLVGPEDLGNVNYYIEGQYRHIVEAFNLEWFELWRHTVCDLPVVIDDA